MDILTDLERGLHNIIAVVASQYNKLMTARNVRLEYEDGVKKCESWIKEAETAMESDVKGSTNFNVIEEQFAKVQSIIQ